MNLTNEDIVGSLLPNVYISRIILQSIDHDKLTANVQFVLKETYGNDDISSWLEDSEVLRYLKIFVIQSADEELTKNVQQYFNGIEGRTFFLTQQTFEQYKDFLSAAGKLKNVNDLIYRQIDLFELFNSQFTIQARRSIHELERLGIAEKVDNDDGSQSYNIYMNVDFTNGLDENPKHLSYIFGTMYDISSLPLIKELEITEMDRSVVVGELTAETVISEGEVQQTTFIYTDEQGNIWPGPIHLATKNGVEFYRSGQTESADSFDLLKVEIENNKVQDFREIKRSTDSFKLDLVPSTLLAAFEEVNLQKELFVEGYRSSISTGYLSVDNSKNVSISFFIDFKKMFINNSIYGQVLSKINNTTAKSLIDSFYQFGSLESVVLYAKRVDIDDSLSVEKQTEKIVAEYYGISQIEELDRPIVLPDIDARKMRQLHMFSVVDSKTEKEGTYKYFLEVEYKDGVVENLAGLITRLKEEQNFFNAYYLQASSPAIFNSITNRFIKDAFSDFSEIPAYDFSFHGRIFLTVASKLFSYIYGSDLEMVTGQKSPIRINRLRKTISRWLNPSLGTPETFSFVIKLYDQMIKTLENTISSIPFVNNSLNEKNEGIPVADNKTLSTSKVIKIRRNLQATVDFENSYMFDYLNHTKPDNTTLGNSTPFLYEILKTDLVSKKMDFNKNLTKVRNANEQNVLMFNNLYDIISDLADIQITKKTQIQIPNANRVQDLARAIEPFNSSILNNPTNPVSNASFDLNDKKTLNTLFLSILNTTVDKSGQNIEFIFDSSRVENIYWDIQPEKANSSKGNVFDQIANNVSDKNLIITDLFKESRMTVEDAKALPNQIKSLIKLKIDSPDVIKGDAEIRFKFEMLKQIKFISGFGYDASKEVFDLGNATWKILDGLAAIQTQTPGALFCKLIDYTNKKINYNFNQALKEAVINECFFINNQQTDDFGLIKTGATQISLERFEQRCVKELQIFFNGQDTPKVDYFIDGKNILATDSYLNSKYSYLSPYAVQFDNKYRVINYHESITEEDFTPIQTSEGIGGRGSRRLPNLSIGAAIYTPTDDNLEVKIPSIASVLDRQKLPEAVRNKLLKIKNPASLAIYSRNTILR